MSETWTEYAVRALDGHLEDGFSKDNASAYADMFGGTIVGRTVTASDWLPVDGAQ